MQELILNLNNQFSNYLIKYTDSTIIIYREKELIKNLVEWFTICKFHTVPILIKKIKNIIESDKINIQK